MKIGNCINGPAWSVRRRSAIPEEKSRATTLSRQQKQVKGEDVDGTAADLHAAG